jgi:hypothetical protein
MYCVTSDYTWGCQNTFQKTYSTLSPNRDLSFPANAKLVCKNVLTKITAVHVAVYQMTVVSVTS